MKKDEYVVEACGLSDLSATERTRCLRLIADGGAVTMKAARRDFPRSLQVAVARKDGALVGVSAVKPVRDHAMTVADLAEFPFDPDTPEFGYVVVDHAHRGNKLSSRMAKLLSGYPGPLFATTSDPSMKSALKGAGFVQRGVDWKGRRGDKISLWIRS
jgi:hypothetical protein